MGEFGGLIWQHWTWKPWGTIGFVGVIKKCCLFSKLTKKSPTSCSMYSKRKRHFRFCNSKKHNKTTKLECAALCNRNLSPDFIAYFNVNPRELTLIKTLPSLTRINLKCLGSPLNDQNLNCIIPTFICYGNKRKLSACHGERYVHTLHTTHCSRGQAHGVACDKSSLPRAQSRQS